VSAVGRIHLKQVYTATKAKQNEALLWKTAVLGMKKPPVGARTFLAHALPFPELQFSRGEFNILYFELSYKITMI
jgi:hypothetical protein